MRCNWHHSRFAELQAEGPRGFEFRGSGQYVEIE